MTIFLTNVAQIIRNFLGDFEKPHSSVKTLVFGYFLGNFWQHLGYFLLQNLVTLQLQHTTTYPPTTEERKHWAWVWGVRHDWWFSEKKLTVDIRNQCGQIWLFLPNFGCKFCNKSCPNIMQPLGLFCKRVLLGQNTVATILTLFGKNWATFCSSNWSHCSQQPTACLALLGIILRRNEA